MKKLRVLIVEDEPLIALDIARKLENMDYSVAEICHTAEEVREFLSTDLPDLVIMDINLKGKQEGIELGAYINEKLNIPFIYLTSYGDKKTIEEAKHTFPMAYLLKPFEASQLFSAIEIALQNFQQQQKPDFLTIGFINDRLAEKITSKEFEILMDINRGYSNQQLAEAHFISLNTVKTHIKKLFGKLGVDSRSQLIVKVRAWER